MNRRQLLALSALGGTGLAMPALAQGQRVTVYGAAKSQTVDELTTRFTRETGIRVDVVKAGSGDIVRRIRAEAAAPKGDVIWSIGPEQLEASADLLEPFTPAEASAIAGPYRSNAKWAPFSGIVVAFAVNTDELKPAQFPRTWKDLTQPRFKGKITAARVDASGSSYQQLGTVLAAYGEEGWDIFKKIMENTNFAGSSGAVSRLVNDGEALVGLTLEDNALDYKRGGGPVAVIYPEDGTSTVADGMALIKGATNVENGKRFLNWLMSKPIQEYVVKEMGRRAIRSDVAAEGTPIDQIKLVNYDFVNAAAQREAWIARWRTIIGNR